MNTVVQSTSKLALKDADEKLNEVQEYIAASNIPKENIDLLIRVVIILIKHNASKHRQQKRISSVFITTK